MRSRRAFLSTLACLPALAACTMAEALIRAATTARPRSAEPELPIVRIAYPLGRMTAEQAARDSRMAIEVKPRG